MGVRRWIAMREMIAAAHFGAIGKWWFASASRRLGKLSAELSRGRGLK